MLLELYFHHNLYGHDSIRGKILSILKVFDTAIILGLLLIFNLLR